MITADLPSREELGQFFTPAPIARFLASLFSFKEREIRLLDPGAGNGALTAAVVARLCDGSHLPDRVTATSVEIDPRVLGDLDASHRDSAHACQRVGIECEFDVARESFFDFALSKVRSDFFAAATAPFNAAILNPPYRKIHTASEERRQLRAAGLETTNLYTGFLYLAAKLLAPGGELVAIVPRSFCNGPYFRAFREQFFAMMSLRRLHLFDSRTAAFRGDAVLQENIVLHAIRSSVPPEEVMVSTSHGAPLPGDPSVPHPYSAIFPPGDPQRFLHIPTHGGKANARGPLRRLAGSLTDLDLEVSTGRVVDFRARPFLRAEPGPGTFPLIYPSHCREGRVIWPAANARKPNALAAEADAAGVLVPAETYVLTKRFTSKEERRRVVATVFEPSAVSADRVGFENHLNYFHAHGRGLARDLALGLAAYLNSTVIDEYFRQFNGHTQVNATDLRNLPYPSRGALIALGKRIGDRRPDQQETDALVASELL